MPAIAVSSLALLDRHIADLKPSALISLLSPGSMIETPAGFAPERHLKLSIHDIGEVLDGHTHPAEDHVEELIGFIQTWDTGAPLLIHCWAGVSRSTASAFVAACVHNPDVSEATIARQMRALSPTATPNRLIVAHADDRLGRGGRMVDAVAALGRGEDCWEGVPFSLPLRWDTGARFDPSGSKLRANGMNESLSGPISSLDQIGKGSGG